MSRRGRLALEDRAALVVLAAAAPAVVVALALLARTAGEGVRAYEAMSFGVVVLACWVGAAWHVRARWTVTLRTLANLVEAIRVRDFSIRAAPREPGALGDVFAEVNALASSLREQRLEAVEAGALLQTVLAEVDVALLAFDELGRVTLANTAAERLLRGAGPAVLGVAADALGIATWLEGPAPRVLEPAALPGGAVRSGARWELRRATFRRHGLPHVLVVLTDVGRALRVEERVAWQRLVRVLGHEVNNSLAPIHSIASSQVRALDRVPRSDDFEQDLRTGLEVVARRAASLARFLSTYAQLARLPPPELRPVDVGAWIERVARLETRAPVDVAGGPPCTLPADPDQLDALLLNLIKNAAEAALVTQGRVRVRWSHSGRDLLVEIEDDGEGLADGANLFVPFFTTKSEGSGIGLVLSRQIAEAHDGELVLINREDARGCVARLRLPRRREQAASARAS